MVLSHLSGIRHYERDAKKVRESREKASRAPRPPASKEPTGLNKDKSKDIKTEENIATAKESKQAKERKTDFDQEEYYLKTNIENVVQAMDLFKDDPLIFKPGEACVLVKGCYLGLVKCTAHTTCCLVWLFLCVSKLANKHRTSVLQAPPSCTRRMPSLFSVPWWSGPPDRAFWTT